MAVDADLEPGLGWPLDNPQWRRHQAATAVLAAAVQDPVAAVAHARFALG